MLNQVVLIGYLGKDPEIRTFQSGDRIANFSVATTERWKDKNTGEKRVRTQWHSVVLKSSALADVASKWLHKGSLVTIIGQLETRTWDKDGETRYATEVVVHPAHGVLKLMPTGQKDGDSSSAQPQATGAFDLDDEVPF